MPTENRFELANLLLHLALVITVVTSLGGLVLHSVALTAVAVALNFAAGVPHALLYTYHPAARRDAHTLHAARAAQAAALLLQGALVCVLAAQLIERAERHAAPPAVPSTQTTWDTVTP